MTAATKTRKPKHPTIEQGAYGSPRWPTLRVLIRLGLARLYGGDNYGNPPDVVLTPEGRALRQDMERDAQE